MARLSQTIAIEKDVNLAAQQVVTIATRSLQPHVLTGLSRSYQPHDDQGERLPSEAQPVQFRADAVLADVVAALAKMWDVEATKDWGNLTARADVQLAGETLLKDAPAVFLLWLERQLGEIEKFVHALPTLDTAESWSYDDAAGVWKSAPVQTMRTKKVPKVVVKYEATKEHPAQVDIFPEDLPVGTWTTVKSSGAVPVPKQREMLDRLRRLRLAVKTAREEANTVTVTEQKVGEAILNWIFG